MTTDLENIPETATIALDWSTRLSDRERGLFIEDQDLADRVESVARAILDCGMTNNEAVLTDLLFVMGAVPPKIHGPILLSLGKADPSSFTSGMRRLSVGSESERFAHRSLIETLARMARHGLLIDAMGDEELVNEVRSSLVRAQGGK